MRGDDPQMIDHIFSSDWVSPACAGMIPLRYDDRAGHDGEPRMRGDDPYYKFDAGYYNE